MNDLQNVNPVPFTYEIMVEDPKHYRITLLYMENVPKTMF